MRTKQFCLGAILFISIQAITVADDTDIYVNARASFNSEPMVFLTLDYRANLGSNLCSQVNPPDPAGACGILLGEAYPNLTVTAGAVTLFDGIRAVFTTLFNELEGVKVAFLLNHDDSCVGQNSGGGPSVSGCSNGAYFVKGLQSFDANDSNNAKADMLVSLNNIPVPQGNLSHPYQGKELYFELFRYLTGQAWHNVHMGWSDYGTNSSQNLPADIPLLSWDTTIETGANYITPCLDTDAVP